MIAFPGMTRSKPERAAPSTGRVDLRRAWSRPRLYGYRGAAAGPGSDATTFFAFEEPTLRPHTLSNGSAHGADSGATQVHPEAASTSPLAALAALQVLQWHAAHRGR